MLFTERHSQAPQIDVMVRVSKDLETSFVPQMFFYWRYVWPVDIYRDFFSAKLLLRDLWMRCSQSTMWMVDTCHFRLTANLPKLVTGLIWLDSSRVSSNEEFFHKVPATVEYAASTNGTKQSTLKVLFFTCLIQTLETMSSCDKNMHFFLDVQRLGWPFQNMLWGNPYLFFLLLC